MDYALDANIMIGVIPIMRTVLFDWNIARGDKSFISVIGSKLSQC